MSDTPDYELDDPAALRRASTKVTWLLLDANLIFKCLDKGASPDYEDLLKILKGDLPTNPETLLYLAQYVRGNGGRLGMPTRARELAASIRQDPTQARPQPLFTESDAGLVALGMTPPTELPRPGTVAEFLDQRPTTLALLVMADSIVRTGEPTYSPDDITAALEFLGPNYCKPPAKPAKTPTPQSGDAS
jgi:hypothetical protein